MKWTAGAVCTMVVVALAASLVLMVQARREPYKCNPNAATVASAAAAAGLSSGEIIAAAAAVGGGTALGIALSDEAKKKEKEEQAAGGGGGGGSTPSGNPFCKTLRFGTGKVVAACVKVGDKTPQQTLGEPTPAAQWDCQFFEVQAEGKTWHYRDCKQRGAGPAPGPKQEPTQCPVSIKNSNNVHHPYLFGKQKCCVDTARTKCIDVVNNNGSIALPPPPPAPIPAPIPAPPAPPAPIPAPPAPIACSDPSGMTRDINGNCVCKLTATYVDASGICRYSPFFNT